MGRRRGRGPRARRARRPTGTSKRSHAPSCPPAQRNSASHTLASARTLIRAGSRSQQAIFSTTRKERELRHQKPSEKKKGANRRTKLRWYSMKAFSPKVFRHFFSSSPTFPLSESCAFEEKGYWSGSPFRAFRLHDGRGGKKRSGGGRRGRWRRQPRGLRVVRRCWMRRLRK